MKKNVADIFIHVAIIMFAQARMSCMKSLQRLAVMAILISITGTLAASEMRWVLLPSGTNGSCVSNTDCNQNIFCYGLEYTPDNTGDLTSYTTAFFVDCVNDNSPVTSNMSCVMTDNSSVVNGCIDFDLIQMHSSGHTGTFDVTVGVPVIIHQVCFTLPAGVTINVVEDVVTDLTTSIDLPGGGFETEYPEYDVLTISGITPNVVTSTNDDGCGSLREMILNATTGSTITFSSALNNQTIILTSGGIEINKDLTLQGLGMLNLAFSGNNASIIFHITPGNELTIKDLSLKDATASTNGGAVFAEGNLTLQNVLLKNNFENGVPKSMTIGISSFIEILGTVNLKI